MPNIHSKEKSIRKNKKRRTRNRHSKSRLKTIGVKAKSLLLEGKESEAREALSDFYSLADKMASKGVLKPNTVARRKSKLTQLAASAASKGAQANEPTTAT